MEKKTANLLLLDIGSTFTKATAMYRNDTLSFIGRTQSPTIVENIVVGVDHIKENFEKSNIIFAKDTQTYATSSAAGGLRMVALGYMPKVTAKAAKEVAMNAGAKVLEVLSHNEPASYKREVLEEINPDIILLAGGTDGGDVTSVIQNATIIGKYSGHAITIYAGNKKAQEQVYDIITSAGKKCVLVQNVMPTIHKLNVKPARQVIHEEFIKQITAAKGMDKLLTLLSSHKVMPTPGAVLLAAERLAKGTYTQDGLESVMLVDLGGATTDVHSVLAENENISDEDAGLIISNEKQPSYRTIEGNLGMRISADGVVEAVGAAAVLQKVGMQGADLENQITEYSHYLAKNPEHIASTHLEKEFDVALAATAVEVALKRHAGFYAQEYNPVLGIIPGVPVGRDLRMVKYVIGVGGIFANSSPEQSNRILQLATQDPGISLLPTNPKILFDHHYLFYAIGILEDLFPEKTFSFAKEYLSIPKAKKKVKII